MKHSRGVVSLFSGAGGLDIGLEAAGYTHLLCVERDNDCVRTLRRNRPNWHCADPGDLDLLGRDQLATQAGVASRETFLLAAGPPCQPFSKAGFWVNGDVGRLNDPRSGTLARLLDIVEHLLPEVLLVENVSGLAFRNKSEGLTLVTQGLSSINATHRTRYDPIVFTLNAADYGVPQTRERVFVVAHREGQRFSPPPETHYDPFVQSPPVLDLEPYLTAWDAIGDLNTTEIPPDLRPSGKWADLLPSIPEGSNYLFHTPRSANGEPLFGWRTRYWSFLLKLAKRRPAWTIQATPGPATGPFHWQDRLLSVRELSRLQTFPDEYDLQGDFASCRRQAGNAVPPAIGELLGLEIRRQFAGQRVRRRLRLIPNRQPDCPPPETPQPVAAKYLALRGKHADHPGTGLGPRAALRNSPPEETRTV